jgi:hypothetical protein
MKGDTVSFWDDFINGAVYSQKFPNLLEFAKEPRVSQQQIWNAESLLSFFRIPMTRQAYNELLSLQTELTLMQLDNLNEEDCWYFIWGNKKYSSSKYYQHQFASLLPPQPIRWIWKAKCIPKIKFFSWLLLNDRLNTETY